jgi:hypothetical protein
VSPRSVSISKSVAVGARPAGARPSGLRAGIAAAACGLRAPSVVRGVPLPGRGGAGGSPRGAGSAVRARLAPSVAAARVGAAGSGAAGPGAGAGAGTGAALERTASTVRSSAVERAARARARPGRPGDRGDRRDARGRRDGGTPTGATGAATRRRRRDQATAEGALGQLRGRPKDRQRHVLAQHRHRDRFDHQPRVGARRREHAASSFCHSPRGRCSDSTSGVACTSRSSGVATPSSGRAPGRREERARRTASRCWPSSASGDPGTLGRGGDALPKTSCGRCRAITSG